MVTQLKQPKSFCQSDMINWSLENLDIQLNLKLFFTNENNWSASCCFGICVSNMKMSTPILPDEKLLWIFLYICKSYKSIYCTHIPHTCPKTLYSTGIQKEWQCVKILCKCWIMSGEDFENVSFIKVLASSFSTISCFFQFKVNDNQFIQEEWTLFSKPHVKDKKYRKGTD